MVTILLFLLSYLSLTFLPPEVTAFDPGYWPHPWFFVTLFTHMISHGSWAHLFGNFMFGAPWMFYVEHRLKSHSKFIWLFLLCGLCGVAMQCAVGLANTLALGGMIGSSAAIFGITAYALASVDHCRWARAAALTLLTFHLYVQGSYSWEIANGAFAFVAFPAHFGGILCGASLALWPRAKQLLRRRSSK